MCTSRPPCAPPTRARPWHEHGTDMSAVLKPGEPRLAPLLAADLDQVMAIERDIYEFPWTRGNFEDSMGSGYSCWTTLYCATSE